MTKTNKKILLGTTVGLAAIAIPVATAVSCGKSDSKKINVDPFAISNFQDWYDSHPISQTILTAEGGEYFNVHLMNIDDATNSKQAYGWDKIYSKTIKLDNNMDIKAVATKINNEMKAVISKLSPLHQRTLVYSATDIMPADTKSKREYTVNIYDTLKASETKLNDRYAQYVDGFLKSSNVVADSYLDFANIEKIKPQQKTSALSQNVYRYFTSASSLRNREYDNGYVLTPNRIFNKNVDVINFMKDMETKHLIDNDEKKGFDAIVAPRTNLNEGTFAENISLFDEANLQYKDDNGSLLLRSKAFTQVVKGVPSANYYKAFKTVFTINPVVQNVKDKTPYAKMQTLTDDQLVTYFSRGVHSLLLKATADFGVNILQGIKLIQTALPSTTPFAAPSLQWIRDVKDMIDKQAVITPNKTEARKIVVKKIATLVRNKLSEIKKAITDSKTTSLNRVAFSYNRDINEEFQKLILGQPRKTLAKLVETNGKYEVPKIALADLTPYGFEGFGSINTPKAIEATEYTISIDRTENLRNSDKVIITLKTTKTAKTQFVGANAQGEVKIPVTVSGFKDDIHAFTGNPTTAYDKIINAVGINELLDANEFLLTTLFDSMNSMTYISDILHAEYVTNSKAAPAIYKK